MRGTPNSAAGVASRNTSRPRRAACGDAEVRAEFLGAPGDLGHPSPSERKEAELSRPPPASRPQRLPYAVPKGKEQHSEQYQLRRSEMWVDDMTIAL